MIFVLLMMGTDESNGEGLVVLKWQDN